MKSQDGQRDKKEICTEVNLLIHEYYKLFLRARQFSQQGETTWRYKGLEGIFQKLLLISWAYLLLHNGPVGY